MAFKNLVFIDHPNNRLNGIMAKYRFNSGKELSVVAGDNLYCTTKYGLRKGNHLLTEDDVSKFEVMIGGEVKGWQTRKDIDQIFKDYE